MKQRLDSKVLEKQVFEAARIICCTPEVSKSAWCKYQDDRRFGQAVTYLDIRPFCYPPFVYIDAEKNRIAIGSGVGWYSDVMKPESIKLSIRVLIAEPETYELMAFLVPSNYDYDQDQLSVRGFDADVSFFLLMRDFWLVPVKNNFPSGISRLSLGMNALADNGFVSRPLADLKSVIEWWSFSEDQPNSENMVVMATCGIGSIRKPLDFIRLDLVVFKPPKSKE